MPPKRSGRVAATSARTASQAGKKRSATTAGVDKNQQANKKIKVKQASKGAPASTKITKPKAIINIAPADRLDIYVFGSNSNAELGLGPQTDSRAIKRPRLNPLLSADAVGVVEIATGAQHCIALTHDAKVLTWGANDLGALGRDTKWDGGLVDQNANDDDDGGSDSDEGAELNPKEAAPTTVDAKYFGEETVTSVAASDNASWVVTDLGHVYGWGTFRDSEGHSRFSATVEVQKEPVLIPQLLNVTKLATGTDHVLALTKSGDVFAFGMNDACQLGRRSTVRHKLSSLVPSKVGKLPKQGVVSIAAGSYHSFAVDKKGVVYACGLNNFGQTGLSQGLGEDGSMAVVPAPINELKKYGPIASIAGGEHHSIAATVDGQCLVWGRLDGSQTGLDVKQLGDDEVVKNEYGMPKILKAAGRIPNLKVALVDAGIDCNIVVTKDGEPYSWGFSESYRTGQGTDDDVLKPTQIANTAIKDKKIVWAGCGGQFGMLASHGA